MIIKASVSALSSNNELVKLIQGLIDSYRRKAGQPMTLQEIMSLFIQGVTGLTSILLRSTDGGTTKAELREQILNAVGVFYEEVIRPIDIKAVPNFVEGWVDDFAKSWMMSTAAAVVDNLFALLNFDVVQPATPDASDGDVEPAKPLHNVVGSVPMFVAMMKMEHAPISNE